VAAAAKVALDAIGDNELILYNEDAVACGGGLIYHLGFFS
jgi:hypothetical protein